MRAGQLPELVANLVLFKVDVIVAAGDPAIDAARHATGTIPIIMVGSGDPMGAGLVASLARPGGEPHGPQRPVTGAERETTAVAEGGRARSLP